MSCPRLLRWYRLVQQVATSDSERLTMVEFVLWVEELPTGEHL